MLGFNRFAFILCYCGHNIYIVFRFREFHRNMSQRRANMLNMFLDLVLLKDFFVCTNRVLFIVCCFSLYPRLYRFSVVVKNCKPLIKLFIRSLRICPKSVNTYIFVFFLIL